MPRVSTVRPSPHALLPLVASRGQRFAREELQEGRTPPCSTSALRLSTVRANSVHGAGGAPRQAQVYGV